ncbi:hypothetical protein HPP92_011883 [Vanilla planifolia]|uniref:PWWP domain-containing protein n=1 Tax=Vanilla planifolia TaxID=51239 RepID=A0A835QWI6_VANPL|nr:hypothetical protein HPP92_011883 [Vanilla planifolia]
MGSSRRKGSARAAAAAAAARQQWKIGDLVLAKMKGFPAWPAMISEPEKWGFSSDRKKLLVYFYGTKQIAFCNYADIEAFTEEKKKSLLLKRQGKGADFVRAVEEIIDVFETLKEKNLAVGDSVDENNDGTVSNKENLKDSTVSSFGKTEEAVLNSSENLQSQCASATESCNMVNEDVNPGTLPDCSSHNRTILENGLGEKVSILDQLRKIPLSSISTTRKRARDAIFLSSCRKSCVSSHRRSRSSSGYKLDKPENASLQAEFGPDAGLQGAEIFQEHHSTKEHAFIGSIVSASTETSSMFSGVPTNGVHVENLAFKSENINLGDGNVFSCNDNIESSINSACLNVLAKGDGSINATVDITLKAVAVKRQRKPRKPGAICSEVDKEMESQIENGSRSDSSNSQDGITEKFSKADGDKHLPLVKRARVRMGKPPEDKMDDSMLLSSKVDDNVISATPVPNPLNESLERDSSTFKEAVGSKSNGCTCNNTGRDSLSCKANKCQLTLVVEAALPPSKRLHRALGAMSANAADFVTDRSQSQRAMETKFDDIKGCLKANSDRVYHSESVKCSIKPLPLQSSNDSAFHGSACGFSSSLTAQDQVVYGSTSSKLESDDTCLTKNMIDPIEKNCKKNLIGNGIFDDSITSKMTGTPSQTCSLDVEEKRCGECVYNHLASPVVEENGWKQLGEESTYRRKWMGVFTCGNWHVQC